MALKQKSKKVVSETLDSEPVLKKKKSTKTKSKAPEEDVEVEVKTLPTVEESPELKKIADASQEAEKKVAKKKKKAVAEEESEAEKKKSFLSVENTTKDGETPKVPSYSAPKNRGVVYIRSIFTLTESSLENNNIHFSVTFLTVSTRGR